MIGQSKVPAADFDWFAMRAALGVASAVVLALVSSYLRLKISRLVTDVRLCPRDA